MNKKIRVLVVFAFVLVLAPFAAPFAFSVAAFASGKGLLIDYMMPAELFGLVFSGSIVLLVVSLRIRRRRGYIISTVLIAFSLLGSAQLYAVLTGLASGRTQVSSGRILPALVMLTAYDLLLPVIAFGGVLLFRDLLKTGAKE